MSFSFIRNACIRLANFVTMMLVLVREWIWDVLERGLEAGVLGAVPSEVLICLVFELPKIYSTYYQEFTILIL